MSIQAFEGGRFGYIAQPLQTTKEETRYSVMLHTQPWQMIQIKLFFASLEECNQANATSGDHLKIESVLWHSDPICGEQNSKTILRAQSISPQHTEISYEQHPRRNQTRSEIKSSFLLSYESKSSF